MNVIDLETIRLESGGHDSPASRLPGGVDAPILLRRIAELEKENSDLHRWLDSYIAAGPPGSINEIQALRIQLAAQNAALVNAHRALAIYAMPNPSWPERHLTAASALWNAMSPELLLEQHDAEIWKAAETKALRAIGEEPDFLAEMPQDLPELIQAFGVRNALRSAVRATKKGIAERLQIALRSCL